MVVIRSLSLPGLAFNSPSVVYNSHFPTGYKLNDLDLGRKTSVFSRLGNSQILYRNKPRCQKPKLISDKIYRKLCVRDSEFNRKNLGLFKTLQSGNMKPRSSRAKFVDTGFSGANLGTGKFIVNSKSALGVDETVERDGTAGGGEENSLYDAIVIGSGIGGLVASTQLAVKGAKVLVLEKYVIPGGSSGYYQKDGYTFDVGSSVMFGFSDKGNLNLITQALSAVGCEMQVIPDPTTVHFHLPTNLSVRIHREYDEFIAELVSNFPHEKEGILKFYGDCWKIFNALNSLELKSLEEPIYLFGQFFQKPLECLTLAYYLPQNAGDLARKYIKDPRLLSFIDAECFIVSTVNALQTPMINAAMVLCDRHFGGINYPIGGVGGIAKSLAKGLVDHGSSIMYKANVTKIITKNGKAVGVKLSDGREFFAKTIVSNATRWDTFGKLLKGVDLPKEEENFQKLYVKAPSFLSIHMGVKAEVLPPDTDCHHFVLENDWRRLEEPYGSIFLSIPTVLDASLAPDRHHILHIFTTSSIEDWEGLSRKEYEAKKELIADEIITRLEKKLFPGLKSSIDFMEVGTPKTHRRFLARNDGTYGPMPRSTPKGLLGMPFNTTGIDGLYCVGDSCFPGQGVIAVAFSGVMCAHRVAADIGLEKKSPILDAALLRLLGWLRTLA
ncbi:prolycopene isomerase, chloroplastic isoform X2 [Benincasa hispida]|uniref:prolycopene isomerase, chloroplastic isoform X2 n=1 Tax=Benincasa hispida TaxID=102211 RepID=UPI0019024F7A|nr:prolycopene isomerase, chloroplastic isoform X2 [Benincasa hispida]